MTKISYKYFLFVIITAAFFLRTFDINWDQGFHLHPDERAIIMFTLPLRFPASVQEFLSPTSPLNPHFFAYGNFPLYLLKDVSFIAGNFNPSYLNYEGINIVGRYISALADTATVFLLFLIGKKLFSKKIGLLASFIYAVFVFPIQLSHYYAVDTLLTFFITATLLQLLNFYTKPSIKNSLLTGVLFGFCLTTKVSAIPLIVSVFLALGVDFFLVFLKQPHKPRVWSYHIPVFMKRLIIDGLLIFFGTVITFIILEPYAIIDYKNFIAQNILQSQMSKTPFIFPYTLQYVGKIPYLYEIKNIFLWGIGPILGIFSTAGLLHFVRHIFNKGKKSSINGEIIILSFFLTYFLVVGKFAVGWMRYMLPVYPLLALFVAFFLDHTLIFFRKSLPKKAYMAVSICIVLIICVWTYAYLSIYTKPNTRYSASVWINQNIPAGSVIAIEHWDDALPLFGSEKYNIQTLELYNPDIPEKWQKIHQQLSRADYIILASNRLYTPLQKLTDCKKLPIDKCYPMTAAYYYSLFNQKLGFEKIKEFTSYPTINLGSWSIKIKDDSADESFTVNDHPKVIIFKKTSYLL